MLKSDKRAKATKEFISVKSNTVYSLINNNNAYINY